MNSSDTRPTGFGRRSANELSGTPASLPQSRVQVQGRSSAAPTDASGDARVSTRELFAFIITTILVLAWLEALLSETALITPISSVLLNVMRVIGVLFGLGVSVIIYTDPTQAGGWRMWVAILFMPLLVGFAFNEIAWRIADWSAFGFSTQAFESAHYRVEDVNEGHRGRRDSVGIDPFDTGENTDIPIPSEQYRELLIGSGRVGCVTVAQRKSASGAIEIATNGLFTMSEPKPVEITPC